VSGVGRRTFFVDDAINLLATLSATLFATGAASAARNGAVAANRDVIRDDNLTVPSRRSKKSRLEKLFCARKSCSHLSALGLTASILAWWITEIGPQFHVLKPHNFGWW
jgi:hypothetical protein